MAEETKAVGRLVWLKMNLFLLCAVIFLQFYNMFLHRKWVQESHHAIAICEEAIKVCH